MMDIVRPKTRNFTVPLSAAPGSNSGSMLNHAVKFVHAMTLTNGLQDDRSGRLLGPFLPPELLVSQYAYEAANSSLQ